MSGRAKSVRSLQARCFGPDALPLSVLAQRGESAARKIRTRYDAVLQDRLSELESLCAAAPGADEAQRRERFLETAADLRSSAAMAGFDGVADFAALMEQAVMARHRFDAMARQVATVHLDAIRMAASPASLPAQLAVISDRLSLLQQVAQER